jgi:hypothetical protein
MNKPLPRTVFADDADKQNYLLDCVCWMYAEESTNPHLAADTFKELVLAGLIVIDYDEDWMRLVGSAAAKKLN